MSAKSTLRILRLALSYIKGFKNLYVCLARSSHLEISSLMKLSSRFLIHMQACSVPLDSIFSNVIEDTQEGAAS